MKPLLRAAVYRPIRRLFVFLHARLGDSLLYGHDRTIHRTGHLDVEVRGMTVVAVWFRCLPLPFRQSNVDLERAANMMAMSHGLRDEIQAIEVKR